MSLSMATYSVLSGVWRVCYIKGSRAGLCDGKEATAKWRGTAFITPHMRSTRPRDKIR